VLFIFLLEWLVFPFFPFPSCNQADPTNTGPPAAFIDAAE
jgi:hypothetical protein